MKKGKQNPAGTTDSHFKNAKWVLVVCVVIIAVSAMLISRYRTSKVISETFTIGTSASISGALWTIADEKGFFKRQGLKVIIKWYKSSGAALDDMLDGKISITGVSETPIMYNSFNRNDFRIFATGCTNSNDPKIIVRTDQVKNEPKELRGKRIGTTKIGQSAHFFLYLFLLKHNISADAVTIVHDSPSVIVEKLANGDIHAASLFEPYATFAAERLKENGRIFAEPGLYSKTFNMVAKSGFLNTNRDTIERMLRALIEAEKFSIEQPDQFVEIISKRHNTRKNLIEAFLSQSSFEVTLNPSLISTLNEEAKWAIKYKLTSHTKTPDYTNFIFSEPLKSIRPGSVGIQ